MKCVAVCDVVCCSVLQCVAVCCSVLQCDEFQMPTSKFFVAASLHTATHCNKLQQTATHTTTHCSIVSLHESDSSLHTATHCNKMQLTLHHTATQTAIHCNTVSLHDSDSSLHTATHCNKLQHTATHCNTENKSVLNFPKLLPLLHTKTTSLTSFVFCKKTKSALHFPEKKKLTYTSRNFFLWDIRK